MEVAEAARTEAVEAPQPGVDYCARVAGIARSVRLTLLLEDKMSRPSEDAAAEGRGPTGRDDRQGVARAAGDAGHGGRDP